jgi:outer membrane protein
MTRLPVLALAAATLAALAPAAAAQQKLGYIDSDVVLERMPEYRTVQQEIDRLAATWQAEVDALAREADALEAEFAAREILYTDEERDRQLAAVAAKRQEHDALRRRYFAAEGELFREQQARLRPVQERLLAAIEAVAADGEYDFVFDRAGDYLFLYARPRHDLTDLVVDELGLGVGAVGQARE